MALTFDMSETALYVADKAGDVYRYAIEDDAKEPSLILGHVSMLLDVVCTLLHVFPFPFFYILERPFS